jgi:hypothetical protein
MEHSSTPPLLLLRRTMYVFPYFTLCAGTLGRHKTNEGSAGIPGESGHCLRVMLLFIYCFLLYAGWLDSNVSYVGLVMCRHQRPLFDLAAVRNPASWLARVDAGDCLHMENG